MKSKYTYAEIVAVGRKLRRYDNLLNNCAQFKENYRFVVGDISDVEFETIEKSIVKLVARYRAIYNHMLDSIYKVK